MVNKTDWLYPFLIADEFSKILKNKIRIDRYGSVDCGSELQEGIQRVGGVLVAKWLSYSYSLRMFMSFCLAYMDQSTKVILERL